jgi:hypothetical protein
MEFLLLNMQYARGGEKFLRMAGQTSLGRSEKLGRSEMERPPSFCKCGKQGSYGVFLWMYEKKRT